jgi:hypothetical protein
MDGDRRGHRLTMGDERRGAKCGERKRKQNPNPPLGQVFPFGHSPLEGVLGTHCLLLSCHLITATNNDKSN